MVGEFRLFLLFVLFFFFFLTRFTIQDSIFPGSLAAILALVLYRTS